MMPLVASGHDTSAATLMGICLGLRVLSTEHIGIMPLVAAGHDTSAATLMRLFKEMGTRPDVMQKLRDEQQKARCAALSCPIEPACSN